MNKITIFAVVCALPLIMLLGAKAGVAEKSKDAPANAAEQAEYVGSDVCKPCHIDKVEGFERGSHGIKQDARTPAAKEGCESCHGPGSAHVKSGGGKGVAGIVGLSPKAPYSAEKKNALCLSCHTKGKMALWHGSTHQQRGLACSDCHNVHSGYPKNLNANSQTELCTRCHLNVKADLQKPYHHPLREDKLQCSDCHNPHGSVTEKLIDANSVNENCYKCHADKRGPFLWAHPPVVESCITCHKPHGSTHERMLVERLPYLCQTCHSNSRHPGALYAKTNPALDTYKGVDYRGTYRGCLNCHSQVHGSNHPSGNYFGR